MSQGPTPPGGNGTGQSPGTQAAGPSPLPAEEGDSGSPPTLYRIADLEVDVVTATVTRADQPVPLPRLSFDLLLALIRAAPHILSVEELMDRVWSGLVVNPETVSQRVKLLRDALQDDPKRSRYIAGVRGRGYRLLPAVQSRPAATPQTTLQPPAAASAPRRTSAATIAALMLLTAMAATALWFWRAEPGPTPDTDARLETPPQRSVAVLPFESLSGEAEGLALADGIPETVLHQLASLAGLAVTARTSSFAFRDRRVDAREIGHKLNVRYLLEGSVQAAGARLRVTAQLIDVQSGRHVWSVQFDKTPGDVFAIQDQIASEVARALQLTLDSGARNGLPPAFHADYDAYLVFLRGCKLLAGQRIADLPGAVDALSHAIRLDPQFAPAYARLARARIQLAEYRLGSDGEGDFAGELREARKLVDRAIELDPDSGEAYIERGYLQAYGDLTAADADFRRGLELAPSLARGYEGLAAVLFQSIARRNEALDLIQQARRLDPLEPRLEVLEAVYHWYGPGDAATAERVLQSALSRNPLYVPALIRLATLRWAGFGELAEAAVLAEQALVQDPDNVIAQSTLVQIYLDAGEPAAAERVVRDARAPDPVLRLLLLVDRRQWGEAGEVAYAIIEGGREASVQELAIALAVRMHARQTGDYSRAVAALERMSAVSWEDGAPVLGNGLSMHLDIVGLADMLQSAGDHERAVALLETALEDIQEQVASYGRGEIWIGKAWAAALVMLGRRQEALEVLERGHRVHFDRHNFGGGLGLDPVFEPLAGDARFRGFVADIRRNAAAERRQLLKLRSEGLVPAR